MKHCSCIYPPGTEVGVGVGHDSVVVALTVTGGAVTVEVTDGCVEVTVTALVEVTGGAVMVVVIVEVSGGAVTLFSNHNYYGFKAVPDISANSTS